MALYICEVCMVNYGLRDSGAHSCVCPCEVCTFLQNNPTPVWCHFTHDLDNPEKCGVSIEEQVKTFEVVQQKITRRLLNARPILKLLVLRTGHLESTKDFYAVLGVEFRREKHRHRPPHYAGMIDGLVLELHSSDGCVMEDHPIRLGFVVSGLNEILALVIPTRGTIVKASYDTAQGRKAVVRDPDGRSVELYETSAVPA